MGLAACIVSEACKHYPLRLAARFNKKLQSIFSLAKNLSVVHLRLFKKVVKAVCRV